MGAKTSILQSIFKDISFERNELDFILNRIEKVNLKKGDILITPNLSIQDHYYVASGCLRSYYIDKTGKEHTIQFAIEDWWVSDYISLFRSEKSILHVECLQDSEIYKISTEKFQELSVRFPKIEFYRRKKLERAYASFQKRILENLSNTATERYLQFLSSYPNIEKKVKNYHIASYLGITSESLSRIRKANN